MGLQTEISVRLAENLSIACRDVKPWLLAWIESYPEDAGLDPGEAQFLWRLLMHKYNIPKDSFVVEEPSLEGIKALLSGTGELRGLQSSQVLLIDIFQGLGPLLCQTPNRMVRIEFFF
jgi:hypothetical protein